LNTSLRVSVSLSSALDTCLFERAFLLILARILSPLSGENKTPIVAPVIKPNRTVLKPFLDIILLLVVSVFIIAGFEGD